MYPEFESLSVDDEPVKNGELWKTDCIKFKNK